MNAAGLTFSDNNVPLEIMNKCLTGHCFPTSISVARVAVQCRGGRGTKFPNWLRDLSRRVFFLHGERTRLCTWICFSESRVSEISVMCELYDSGHKS